MVASSVMHPGIDSPSFPFLLLSLGSPFKMNYLHISLWLGLYFEHAILNLCHFKCSRWPLLVDGSWQAALEVQAHVQLWRRWAQSHEGARHAQMPALGLTRLQQGLEGGERLEPLQQGAPLEGLHVHRGCVQQRVNG